MEVLQEWSIILDGELKTKEKTQKKPATIAAKASPSRTKKRVQKNTASGWEYVNFQANC